MKSLLATTVLTLLLNYPATVLADNTIQLDNNPVSKQSSSSIPGFLKVGKTYSVLLLNSLVEAKIIEIDNDSGWINIEEDGEDKPYWINLSQTKAIIPK